MQHEVPHFSPHVRPAELKRADLNPPAACVLGGCDQTFPNLVTEPTALEDDDSRRGTRKEHRTQRSRDDQRESFADQ
jgi:hypothetical protein